MKILLNRIFWSVAKFLFRFRYRVKLSNAEQLPSLDGPTLVLPNHPAFIDPPIVSSHIRLHKPLRPMVYAGAYRMLPLRPLMWLVDAFEVPDLSAHSQDAHNQVMQTIDTVVDRLHAGDCLLIYPSGRLQKGDKEIIGAARAVYDIVLRCPDVNIVLVRDVGLWGSMFSCAAEGKSPNLGKCVLSAIGWVLANLFFFLPRRDVNLHVEIKKPADLPTESRDSFNRYLENWYNQGLPLEPTFVPYHFLFGPREGNYRWDQATNLDQFEPFRAKSIKMVEDILQSHFKRDFTADNLQPSRKLDSIGLDSLDRMEVSLKIEQQSGFHSNRVPETVGELFALADGQIADQGHIQTQAPESWRNAEVLDQSTELLDDTIAAAFVKRALRDINHVICADNLSGVLTYRKLLVACSMMAKRFATIEQPHVGVMLPASVAADIVFFALHMAGKTPVMMNWTTGPTNLAHGIEVTGTKHIVTSKKMIDRMRIEVPGAEYLYLEDIKQSFRKTTAFWELCKTYVWPSSFLKLPEQDEHDHAIFLFTSGSESLPKTVPLTHQNLLTNVRDGLDFLDTTSRDVLLGFLPPFHSFGMTGNLLLPYLSGVRCVRFADPTDARGLVRTISQFDPTLVFTTPTFWGYILSAASGEELHSLRIIVTGAEKCPDAIFEQTRLKAPNATIIEGYGITECSPVVSGNRVGEIKRGTIGKPVKHVDIKVIDVETEAPVAVGETGMLLVAGPSIFGGYYKHDGPDPFIEIDGRRWYRTGDLVSVDSEGFIQFRGRLKRFLKAGGEMISLPALEEPFVKKYPTDENGPKIAVEGIETPDGRHVVLFTTEDISQREANEVLMHAGMRGVMRIDEVRKLDKIPVLATGKTDYKLLRLTIEEDN